MADSAGRSIRVFISSTFRDMSLDREELVARVFPAIRRLCEARGVAFSEVDLRWGVTDEQKAEGAVLPICLAEIERSRPWFIGLIGERYGWVPDEIPAELLEQLGWLDDERDKSVTELEILHGVLNDPESAGHAFFYLRDPAWIETRPPEERATYVDDDPAQHAKLQDLKTRIRTSGHPVRDYPDPVVLGELVHADLVALVDRLYPADEAPDAVDRDAAAHAAYAASRFADHVARPGLVGALDEWAASDQAPLLVTGELGAGASALVANWARTWRAAHAEDVVVEHYVGADAAAADWRAATARLVAEVGRRHAFDVDVDGLPQDVAGRRSALASTLGRAASTGRRTVVVLDGLDELDDADGARELAWLPETVPGGVRVVATAVERSTLDAAAYRRWGRLDVPPLTPEERREVVATALARYAKALGAAHTDRVVTAERTGNALFLRVVVDELRQHGDHFTLDAAIDRLVGAATVDDLLELVLERYERDYERDRPGLVGDVFRALWAARRGLLEAELLDVVGPGDGRALPHAVWSPLFLGADQGLSNRAGLLGFASTAHRKAVEDRYLPDDAAKAAAHATLDRYFAAQPMGPRKVEELPWQQLGAGDLDGLVASLADLEFLEAAYRRSLAEVRRLWAAAEAAGRRSVDAYWPVLNDLPSATVDQVWAIARLLTDGGYPDQALYVNRFLVDEARRSGADERLRAALVNLGAALWQAGDPEGAEPVLAEAVERCRAADDRVALAATVGNLAMVRRDRGDLVGAAPLFEEAEALCRQLGDDVGLQAHLGDHAELLRRTGNRDGALALLVEQERLCRLAGDRVGVARARSGQATVLSDRGELAQAVELRREHEATCRETGDLRGLVECLLGQALDLGALGDAAAAQAAATEAESTARRLGDLGLLARVLLAQANAAAGTGRWAEVERLAREAELSARSVEAPAQVALSLGLAGIARREQGDLTGSRALHVQEEQLATPLGADSLAVAWSNLAAVDIAEGKYPDAIARMDRAEPAFRASDTPANLLPLLANRGQVLHVLGQHERAVADLREAGALAVKLHNPTLGRQLLTTAVELLYGTGRPNEAEPVWADLAAACRALGDDAGLQRALGDQALLVMGRGDLDAAAVLLDEQEAICRRIGDQVGLAACVGNRAILLRHRNDFTGALACVDEQLAVARASNNAQGVLFATANRGEVLGLLGRTQEAIAALTEARTMAHQWGVAAMIPQLDQMIASLRN